MANAMLFVVMLPLAFNMSAQTRGMAIEKRSTPVTSDTVIEGWQTGDILTSLIRVGFTNKIPLGIVLEGESLCRNSVPGSGEGIPIGSLIDQVQSQAPNYIVEIRNQTLYVHPRTIKASTLDALELRIPHFTSEPTSAQEIGISLWMYIRAVLVPQETSMFEGGLQRNAETLPSLNVLNLNVQDILDRIITMGQGGMWVMHKTPADWQAKPETMPYEIFSYSGDTQPSKAIKCPEGNN